MNCRRNDRSVVYLGSQYPGILQVGGLLYEELFVAQRDHGIDAGGADRGNVARERGDGCEQRRYSHERQRIGCLHVEEQRPEKSRDAESGGGADRGTNSGERDSLTNDEAKHLALLCAESHSNTDLARSPRHFVGKQPVEADAGEHEREQTKKAREARDKTLHEKLAFNLFCFRAD